MPTSSLEQLQVDVSDDWRDHAQCRGHVQLFFARKAERPEARERREAKARRLCEACPVSTICREWGRVNHEYGYWGGESEEDRHLAGYTLSAPIGIVRERRTDDGAATAC